MPNYRSSALGTLSEGGSEFLSRVVSRSQSNWATDFEDRHALPGMVISIQTF